MICMFLSDLLFNLGSSVKTVSLVLFAVIVWKYVNPLWKKYKLNKKLDSIAGAGPGHWFFGHLKKYPSSHEGFMKAARERPLFNPLMYNHWVAPCFSFLQCYHPDSAIALLSSGAPKNNFGYKFIRPWIGDGLLTSKGKKWQRNRHLLTPAFHFSILKGYVKILHETSFEMLEKWAEKSGNDAIEIADDVALMTLDTMLQCAMSSKTHCQQTRDHPYIKSVQEVASLIVFRLNNPIYLLDFVFWNSKAGKRFRKSAHILHSHAENIIAARKKELKEKSENKQNLLRENGSDSEGTMERKHLDFLDILITTKDEDGKGLSDQEIRDEVDTFLFEGHDTTASGIQWSLYNLAKYPDLQEKCRDEINEVLGVKKNLEWEDLSRLNYLTMFIKENLRLFPPVTIVSRELDSDLKIQSNIRDTKEMVIPPGSTVSLHIFGLHRNPHVWQNPEKFDPERFSKENISKRSPHSFLPFSAGQRNCIGQNFAMMELKIAISQTLRRFRLSLDTNLPEPKILPRLILHCEDGIYIKFQPISDN